MDYLKKSRIEEVLIAILGKGTVTSQLISRIEKILDAIRVKGSYDGIVMSEVEEILVCILLGERFEKPTHSRIAAMLKVKANGGEYTEPRKSRVEELIFEWIEGTSEIITYTGALPATLQTVAGYLASYKIWGNDGGVGAETENLAPFIDEWGDGYVNVRGFIAPADENMKERCSPHIAVEPGATYQLAYQTGSFPESSTSLPWTGVGWYNDDGFIERRAGYDRTTVTLVAPANATYAILSFRSYGENHNVMFIKASTSPASYIPYGYRLPIISNDATTDIYIGDTQLAKNEYVDSTGKIYRYVDGTLTPTDPPTPFPQIPTAAGETTIDYGATILPYVTGLDGIFEYGNIDGLTWKNSVSGENDITFDTAVTDTGAEYVLPAGASGQHTSKSGEYRTAFTWYCIAKCPTTCRDAGQYMISNWNNQGVEISSGWAAYSSAGTNHLIRSINNNDFNSAKTVTSYALIVVSGDANGAASVFVNGEKMTDSYTTNPVSATSAADTIFLGKRASGQLSGTDIDYKFLAFGTTKQTDSEITANSQYLMTKYLGVGRPEKVELTYKTP